MRHSNGLTAGAKACSLFTEPDIQLGKIVQGDTAPGGKVSEMQFPVFVKSTVNHKAEIQKTERALSSVSQSV